MFFGKFKNERVFVAVLVAISLASFFFWNQKSLGNPVISSDQGYYDNIAVNFLRGEGLTEEGEPITVARGYPLFISGVYSVFGHSIDAVRAVQGVLFILIVLMIYALGKELIGAGSARIAAVFTAVFYGLPVSTSFLHREVLIAFFTTFLVYALYKLYATERLMWVFFSGITAGLLAVTNGITKFLFIPITIALIAVFMRRLSPKRTAYISVLFLASFFLVLSPTLIDNYIEKSSLGLAERGGVLLYRAEKMRAVYDQYPGHLIGIGLGYYFAEKLYPDIEQRVFRYVPETEKRVDELKEQGLKVHEYDRILFEEGRAIIFAEPHKFVLAAFLDFLSFNSPFIPHGNEWKINFIHLTFAEGRHQDIPGFLKAGYLLTLRIAWFALLAFAVYFTLRKWRADWRILLPIVIVILYTNGVYSFVHAIPRYAIPIFPLYTLLAVGGIVAFFSKFRMVWRYPFLEKNNEASHSDTGVQ